MTEVSDLRTNARHMRKIVDGSGLPMALSLALKQDIRRLLDPKDWAEGQSSLINADSFEDFIMFLKATRPRTIPYLGLDYDGSVLASFDANGVELQSCTEPNGVITCTVFRATP